MRTPVTTSTVSSACSVRTQAASGSTPHSAWRLASVALAVAMTLALPACGGSSFKRDFIKGCEQNGAPSSICACVYDELLDTYSESEIKALQQQDRRKVERFFEDMISATRACSR